MRSALGRAFLILLLIAVLAAVFVWILNKRAGSIPSAVGQAELRPDPVPTSTPASSPPAAVAETPPPQSEAPINSESPVASDSPEQSFVGKLDLQIPVMGVRSDQLLDTFGDARSEGRVHDAIDIPAAAGTPVMAATDGQVLKLFQSERGGTTIYQLSQDRKLVFYYAHLQRYADGLVEGAHVKRGDVIAYVGDTGNAGAGNFHLHFSIAIVADPRRYWEGTNINPYPLLHR
ncbi:MAG TPA: M23 family metallopeptidase [Pyrinomonadaceae bacterium]